MFSSITGLCALDFSSTPSPDGVKCVLGEKFSPAENHLSLLSESDSDFSYGPWKHIPSSPPLTSPSSLRELLFLCIHTLSSYNPCPISGISFSSFHLLPLGRGQEEKLLSSGESHRLGGRRGKLRGIFLEKLCLLLHFAKNLHHPHSLSMPFRVHGLVR